MGKVAITSIILLLTILFVGCLQIPPPEKYFGHEVMDFRPYAEKGFLITPEEYKGQYESISIVNFTVYPEVKAYIYPEERLKNYKMKIVADKNYYIMPLEVDTVLSKTYDKYHSKGADAICNFSISLVPVDNEGLLYFAYRITGLAIRRSK